MQNLLEVCKILNKNSVIGEKAGGHIHVGIQTIGRNKDCWLNFIKFLDYSKNKEFNKDIAEKRIRNKENSYYNIALYDEIYLDQALKLEDILFDNNLDKVYFLRQYLKPFKIGNNTLEKVNQFTKVAN